MNRTYIAKTFFGLEEVLASEITALGGQNVEAVNRAVSFTGSKEVLYKTNLQCRTALRVLVPILNFKAHNETVLYKRIRRYPWWDLLSPEKTFAIDVTVNSTRFSHSKFVAYKVKDAIVDLMRHKFNNRRPSVDLKDPDLRINVHCRETTFNISLDSSGYSLHRRGYRIKSAAAPLNEALAAGMIILAGWDASSALYDPMYGSGTLLIEAAMLAAGRAPRIDWTRFGFQQWANYDDSLWRKVRNEALSSQRMEEPGLIYGSEIDAENELILSRYLEDIGLHKMVHFRKGDFFQVPPPAESGVLISNPPYGYRMEGDNINGFYKMIGDRLKASYTGWEAWILSANKEAMKHVGLRTSARHTLYNGPLECKFHKYELFTGKLKKKGPFHEVEKDL